MEKLNVRIPNTWIGMGVTREVGDFIKELGLTPKKILIITDEIIVSAGLIDNLKTSLSDAGFVFSVFVDTRPNAPLSVIKKCAKMIKEGGYDLLIGVGGGSTMDTTKVASVLCLEKLTAEDLAKFKPAETAVPIIQIPTTAGTGSEWNGVAVLTDDSINRKTWFMDRKFLAVAVVIDPELTMNMPKSITADTGMDVLAHAIEAYISQRANVVADMFAEKAIQLVTENLRLAYEKGSKAPEARYNMAFAAALGGNAIAFSGVGLAHRMDPELIVKMGISHGRALALLEPHMMEYEMGAVTERLAKIAALMGEDIADLPAIEAAKKSIEAVRKLIRDLGMPEKLSEVGATEKDLKELVDICIKRLDAMNEVSRVGIDEKGIAEFWKTVF